MTPFTPRIDGTRLQKASVMTNEVEVEEHGPRHWAAVIFEIPMIGEIIAGLVCLLPPIIFVDALVDDKRNPVASNLVLSLVCAGWILMCQSLLHRKFVTPLIPIPILWLTPLFFLGAIARAAFT